MSQRTRARTTGAATRAARKPAATPEQSPEQHARATAQAPVTGSPADAVPPVLPPETLARTLRAVADALERDPELARRVSAALAASDGAPQVSAPGTADGDSSAPEPAAARPAPRPFRPRLVTGTSADLGTGVPDPFALYARRGEAGLRDALAELRLGTLRAMLREHGLDAGGRLTRQNDAEKLRAAILDGVGRLAPARDEPFA